MNRLEICGFNNSTDAGPDKFGCSIFLRGCNLRCPYCMNSALVRNEDINNIPFSEILEKVRKNDSDWVFISGGEPTCTKIEDLIRMIWAFKDMGKKVGLSTNGTHPEEICEILQNVDYIAMDIKGNVSAYNNISGKDGVCGSNLLMDIMNTWYMIREEKDNRDFDYEIRSTVYPEFVNRGFVNLIGQFFIPNEKWIFQVYRPTNSMLDKSLDAKDLKNYEKIAKSLMNYAKNKYDYIDISMRQV